jgi:hypothetical protein
MYEPKKNDGEQQEQEKVNDFNDLTIKLMMNKHYCSLNNDNAKLIETQFHEKLELSKLNIQEIFTELIENPNNIISNDVNNSFKSFVMFCIAHIEIKNEIKNQQKALTKFLMEEDNDDNDDNNDNNNDKTNKKKHIHDYNYLLANPRRMQKHF